jgi:hypothetical protein
MRALTLPFELEKYPCRFECQLFSFGLYLSIIARQIVTSYPTKVTLFFAKDKTQESRETV